MAIKNKTKINQASKQNQTGKAQKNLNQIKAGWKGGCPGQWSARKAQMVAKAYKAAGGGYK